MGRASASGNGRSKALRRIVDRARQDPFFLGWALAGYARVRGLDDRELADWLECTPDALKRMALCRLPDEDADRFRREVRQVAEYAPCNANRLAQTVREALALSSLQRSGESADQAFLMAARDFRPADEEPEGDE